MGPKIGLVIIGKLCDDGSNNTICFGTNNTKSLCGSYNIIGYDVSSVYNIARLDLLKYLDFLPIKTANFAKDLNQFIKLIPESTKKDSNIDLNQVKREMKEKNVIEYSPISLDSLAITVMNNKPITAKTDNERKPEQGTGGWLSAGYQIDSIAASYNTKFKDKILGNNPSVNDAFLGKILSFYMKLKKTLMLFQVIQNTIIKVAH